MRDLSTFRVFGQQTMQVNVLEAKNRLSELIKSVQAGQEVIIANRGQPVVRLVPAKPTAQAPSTGNLLAWLEEHPLPPHAQKSADAIDAQIQLERQAWD
jgi:prevent-host-death family protein